MGEDWLGRGWGKREDEGERDAQTLKIVSALNLSELLLPLLACFESLCVVSLDSA